MATKKAAAEKRVTKKGVAFQAFDVWTWEQCSALLSMCERPAEDHPTIWAVSLRIYDGDVGHPRREVCAFSEAQAGDTVRRMFPDVRILMCDVEPTFPGPWTGSRQRLTSCAGDDGVVYGSKAFDYTRKARTFVTEASTLGLAPGDFPDTFRMRSAVTGEEEVFCVVGRTEDGGRQYRSQGRASRLTFVAVIFNS